MIARIKYINCMVLGILLFGISCSSKSQEQKQNADISDEALIRQVANYVIDNTSYQLLDLRTGKSYMESSNLEPSDSIIVESHFNGWFYQNMMVLNGMNRVGKVLDEERYLKYIDKILDFVLHHLHFFDRQEKMGKMPNPQGESEYSRISYYYNLSLPWMTGLANFWIERGRLTGDDQYAAYTKRFETFADTLGKDSSGQFLNLGAIRTDDAALMAPGMLELAKIRNRKRWQDEAVHQVLGAHTYLFDKTDKVYYHGWHPTDKVWYKTYWGRASGWMALAWVSILSGLPEGHPKYDDALEAYREFMTGLRHWQAEEGGWRQVINRSDAWIETSSTGMFTYAMARGVNEGWLDSSYKTDALKGWNALRRKVEENGQIVDTCPSTHHDEDINFYLNRPRRVDDPHAYGPFLLAGGEILKLKNE